MAKCRVVQGGWWWLGVERRIGDVLDAREIQVERWAAEGLVEPIQAKPEPEPEPEKPALVEVAEAPKAETGALKRKRK